MTPKRYFAFGCLTILIQGGVLASQNSQPELQLNSGSAMGSSQAVSLSIAMQASQAPTTPEQITEPVKTKAKPAPQPQEVAKATAKPQPIAKPKAIAHTQAKPLAPKKAVTNKPKTLKEPAKKPTPVKPIEKTQESVVEAQAKQLSHNQLKADAKQGISKQAITLSQPTFAAPPSQPHYPKKARKKGFQGTATVEVMFNQLGEQLSLTLVDSSGYRLLDKAALNAVEKWQFAAPTPQTAYAYTVRVPVRFALN
ncbi:energy transducer TonB [Shewanella sp. MBTL60-007]|uniref:energy transducer TonB n=1 Tax=Shewanella sp. MBTL60-007 TaxID=2815911 RepID=UPI001BBF0955|nr:energy transducer TonB [Shewanella sp. MBTL60-007]GIU14050.1 TonB1 energy transduction system for heme uptake energy transducer component TonB [Shewanella sp. MBTL60-007]